MAGHEVLTEQLFSIKDIVYVLTCTMGLISGFFALKISITKNADRITNLEKKSETTEIGMNNLSANMSKILESVSEIKGYLKK